VGNSRSHSHRPKVRELTPNFTAASRCRTPAKNRFFLRCWPKVVGSLAIGKLRVQTGATSLRATVTLRSQKGNIAHAEHGDDHHVNRVHEIPAVKMIAADANGENRRKIEKAAPELSENALWWSRHERIINLPEREYECALNRWREKTNCSLEF
jgi:hypothetical protein